MWIIILCYVKFLIWKFLAVPNNSSAYELNTWLFEHRTSNTWLLSLLNDSRVFSKTQLSSKYVTVSISSYLNLDYKIVRASFTFSADKNVRFEIVQAYTLNSSAPCYFIIKLMFGSYCILIVIHEKPFKVNSYEISNYLHI